MRIYFDSNEVLHICAENSTEGMALKYWKGEYEAHGDKVLEVNPDPVMKLPSE